jgi:hypothetical protein
MIHDFILYRIERSHLARPTKPPEAKFNVIERLGRVSAEGPPTIMLRRSGTSGRASVGLTIFVIVSSSSTGAIHTTRLLSYKAD